MRPGTSAVVKDAFSFLDGAIDILIAAEAQLVAQVWIKPIGGAFKGIPGYAVSVQCCCAHFQSFLESRSAAGVVIADSRNQQSNVPPPEAGDRTSVCVRPTLFASLDCGHDGEFGDR